MNLKKRNYLLKTLRILRLFFQLIIYIPLQLIFVPFTIVGVIDALYKEMVRSKKLHISFTAIQALQYRWMMHYFDTRKDPLSIRFIKKFPCESHFGLFTTFGPLIIAQRLLGLTTKFGKMTELGKETIVSTPGRRLVMFDEIIHKYVDTVDQIVIPGAGYDLIALQNTKDKHVAVFELDQVATMNLKVKTLEKAGIAHDWVTYIPVDYSIESWSDKLIEAGFNPSKKTLFLWQSVSLFLEDSTVKDSLVKMADLCVEGSVIVQDFYSQAFVMGETSNTVKKSAKMMAKMGEPWKFGIDMATDPKGSVSGFLQECGLQLTTIHQFGDKLDVEPFYCIVEAKKL